MTKKIKFESFVYHFLAEAEQVQRALSEDALDRWKLFIGGLRFRYERGNALINSGAEGLEILAFPLENLALYVRGDAGRHVSEPDARGRLENHETIQARNSMIVRHALAEACEERG